MKNFKNFMQIQKHSIFNAYSVFLHFKMVAAIDITGFEWCSKIFSCQSPAFLNLALDFYIL